MGNTCYVVVLNYNGWKDTIECLESLLKQDYERYRVIVVDNHSANDSVERLTAWARGKLHAECDGDENIHRLVFPEIPKPVSLDLVWAGEGHPYERRYGRVILLSLAENRGFAGGMNEGIRLALEDEYCSHVWLLNNDTVVTPNAMRKLIEVFERNHSAGIADTPMLDYYASNKRSRNDGIVYVTDARFGINRMVEQDACPSYYVPLYNGASFMVTRPFLDKVGLMEERYFLYFEEPDWCIRCGRAGFTIAHGADLAGYHKGGATTGGKGSTARSYLADYYMIRSRILFTKKFFPHYLPSVYLALIGSLANRIRRKQWNRVGMILKLMWNPNSTLKVKEKS